MRRRKRSLAGFDTRTVRGWTCPKFGICNWRRCNDRPPLLLSRVPPTSPSSSTTTVADDNDDDSDDNSDVSCTTNIFARRCLCSRGEQLRQHARAYIQLTQSHRVADPLLGVFTGVLAYRLYEINPRNGIAERDRLLELIKWKQDKELGEQETKSSQTVEDTK